VRAPGALLARSPRPVHRRCCGRRGLSGGLGAAGSAAIASVSKGFCVGHNERDGDSPYEAGVVRRKNLGGATAFHRRRVLLVVGDARRAVVQHEKEKGEVKRIVNQFHGAWGGGLSRKGKMAVIRPISAFLMAGTGGGADERHRHEGEGSPVTFLWGERAR
jgi:hypothetical protein